jgi:TonB-linked SusC/RagA family outer membrane protein
VSSKFKVGVNFRFNNQTINGGGTSASGASINSKLRHTVKYRPFLMNTTSPEELDQAYFEQTSAAGMYLINPIQLNDAEYRKRISYTTNVNGYGDYSFTPYLSFRTTVGLDRFSDRFNTFDDYLTWTAIENSSGMPMVSVTNSTRTSFNMSNVVSFNNGSLKSAFHSKHRIQALIGQELYMYSSDAIYDRLRYFPVGIVPEKALAQLSLGTSFPLYPSALASASRISSFFSRINYSFRNKYIASFTIRADGSSKFAPGKQWGYFPSAALAWRISEESFFTKTNTINDLKLRLTYGRSGNNRINDFLFTPLYTSNSAPYGLNDVLTAGYSITNLANPNIKWETTVSRNLGLDMALFNNKLQVTADFYINDTRDLLINVPIATNSGYSTQIQNIGSTRNKGMELQLNAALVANKDFHWNANFNIASNRNKIISLAGGMDSYFANSGWGISGQLPDFIVKVGQPVGAMYGYVSDGYYTLNDFDYNKSTRIYTLKAGVTDNTGVVGTPQPGSLKLKDLSGDHVVDADKDRTILGDAQPKFFGGLTNQFTYKNFDLSVFVNFTVGNKIFNGDKIEFSNAFNGNTNLLAIMNNRWKTIDANGNVLQRLVGGPNGTQLASGEAPEVLAAANKNASIWQPVRGSSASFLLHSWAIEDGSFLRLNNITFGYNLPKSVLNKIKSGGVRFYCTVNNIAVLTGYSGLDPEVSTKTAVPVTPGVDASPYPRSRSYILGINVKF